MAHSTYRILKREFMAKAWSSLSRLHVEATSPDGKKQTLLREVADHGHGVAVLPMDKSRGTVLLVKQWRAGAAATGHHGWLIEACAGLDDGQNAAAAAIREAKEELGYNLSNLRQQADCFASPGAVSERMVLFLADYSQADRVGAGGGLAEEHEDIEIIETTLDEAYSMVCCGEIEDAKTIILIQAAKIEGL